MAQSETAQPSSQRRQNRFLVMLLVGAAVVSAAKDLRRMQDLTGSLVAMATSIHARVNAAEKPTVPSSCPEALAENDRSGQPYNWNGRVTPERLAAISRTDPEPAAGGGLVANTEIDCSESAPVIMNISPRVVETISHRPSPRQFLSRRNVRMNIRSAAEPARGEVVSRIISHEVNGSSVSSDKRTIRVCPVAGMPLAARSKNGIRELYVPALRKRAEIATKIRILSDDLSVRQSSTDRKLIKLKTADGVIALDLLELLRAGLAAEPVSEETISTESPRPLKELFQRTRLIVPAAADDTH